MRRNATIAAVAAACVLAAGAALVAPAGAATGPTGPSASAAPSSAPTAAGAGGVEFEAWMYWGSSGDAECTARSEYADDRVKNGALKPEYWGVHADGSLEFETAADGDCNGYSAANVADMKAHSAHQYAAVSGMTEQAVHALVSDPAKRGTAVSTMTSLVTSADLDGVDVDLEDFWSWKGQDFTDYTTFLTELATALHAKGKRLQVDTPAMTEDGDPQGYDITAVLATGVDDIVVMAFDEEWDTPSGQSCLPTTPYDWLRQVVSYYQTKVTDPSRLVIALPSYGYSAPDPCDTSQVTVNILHTDMAREPGFSTDPTTVEQRRDPSSGEIRWTNAGTLYDYVDTTAMNAKLKVVTDLGVTRVCVWTLGGGNPWFTRP